MRLDDTLLKIIKIIKEDVKAKYKVEYDVDEIFEVINTQIEATKLGFSKGITVHWIRFCKFVYTERNARGKEIDKFAKDLVLNRDDLTDVEKEFLLRNKIKEQAIKKKKLLALGNSNINSTSEEVINAPVVNKMSFTLFKNITNKK